MVAAFRVARRLGRIDEAGAERGERLLSRLGLPTDVAPYLNDRVFAFLGSDKKRTASSVSYIVPGPPGRVERMPMPLTELVKQLRG
jgi:3-dehydroquinate synthetase